MKSKKENGDLYGCGKKKNKNFIYIYIFKKKVFF